MGKEARAEAPRPPTIRFIRPPPVPVQNRGFAVLNLDGTPEEVRISWRATVQAYRLWCFNSTPDRYQFGHEGRRSCMLPVSGHFLVYLHSRGKWLCAVIHGPSGYLDGYITQSTGEGVRIKENMTDAKGAAAIYIERAQILPWDGGYVHAASCRLGYLGLINSFSTIYKSVQGIMPQPKNELVTSHGETLILHLSEAGRSDKLFSVIDDNFIIGCLLGSDLLISARHWRFNSEKPLCKMEEVCSPEHADKSKGKMIDQGAPRSAGRSKAKVANKKKGNMTDEGAKLANKKERVTNEEKEYEVELEEELLVLEDIRLLHRPEYRRELFHLDKLVVHLAAGRPVNNTLEEYLRPRASGPDSDFLVTPFRKFIRSHEKKEKETSPSIEKTTHDMKRMCAELSDSLHRSPNVVPNVNVTANSAGIANLGNTCYASCALQSLHSIGELKSALYSYPDDVQVNEDTISSHNLAIATRNLFHNLDQNTDTVQPLHFLQTLRESFPQFKEKEDDKYIQQDAEECWELLVDTLSSTLAEQASDPASAPIKNIFKIDLLERMYCAENGEHKDSINSVYDLKCPISDGVHHLNEGLKLHLNSEVEKDSENGQPANYTVTTTINELPSYIKILFLRSGFLGGQMKNKNEMQYPLELDVYDFCSAELKPKIQACRQSIGAENAGCNSLSVRVEPSSSDMYKDGPSLTGMYELIAVVTHNGDTPNSGHYIAWVKQEDDLWIQYDDDIRTAHHSEEVLKLCGGGEGQMAHLCLYRACSQGWLDSARA